MNHSINDSFMNLSRFGNANIPFKLSDKEPRHDVPKWRINRSNSRSMGKTTYLHTKPFGACLSLIRRVYNNDCFDCWKLRK